MQEEATPEITPTELKARLDRGDHITLVDVREQEEWDAGSLEAHGARHMPIGDIPALFHALDPGDEVVVYCRGGGRSERVVGFLRDRGFRSVLNLKGGIHAWSDEVDPSIPKV